MTSNRRLPIRYLRSKPHDPRTSDTKITSRLKRKILRLFDDGYTVHEIAESQGLHCVAVATVVSGVIEKDAAECA